MVCKFINPIRTFRINAMPSPLSSFVMLLVAIQLSIGTASSPSPLGTRSVSRICDGFESGSVIQGIVSIYNHTTRSRNFSLICENLRDAGLQHLGDFEWIGKNFQWVRRRLDIPEPPTFNITPADWTMAGCRDNEIMVGINTIQDQNDITRFEFVCMEYLSVRVSSALCNWAAPEKTDVYLVMAKEPEGFGPYVFNGIRSKLNNLTGERDFEFRMCASYTFREWPRPIQSDCQFGHIQVGGGDRESSTAAIDRASQSVMHRVRVTGVQECGRFCNRHPFCYQFIWTPHFKSPAEYNCQLSYGRLPTAKCGTDDGVNQMDLNDHKNRQKQQKPIWRSSLSHLGTKLSDDTPILVSCLRCPASFPADGRREEERGKRIVDSADRNSQGKRLFFV